MTLGGNTPLHLDVSTNLFVLWNIYRPLVKKIDSLQAKNLKGKTPVDLASIAPNARYELLNLLHSIMQCKIDYPVYLIGNSAAGNQLT